MATRATKTSPSHVTIQWQKKSNDLPTKTNRRKNIIIDYIIKSDSLHLTNMLYYPILSCLCLNLDPENAEIPSMFPSHLVYYKSPMFPPPPNEK